MAGAPDAVRGESGAPQMPAGAPVESVGDDMVALEGGDFVMGSDEGLGYDGDDEGPTRVVTVAPFRIATGAVTNAQFDRFVAATGHRSEAERFGWSFVFAGLLPDEFPETRGVVGAEWWRQVFGAYWRAPEGPQSNIDDRGDHPVLHVSWHDAQRYCEWAGTRLPSEVEWEFAARGGLAGKRYPWGDELQPDSSPRCNIWQGTFPTQNTLDDGFYGTAPVTTFAPNGYGLFNMVGNAWEWCADAFGPGDVARAGDRSVRRVMRGGSYLCHESYCFRYRVSARSSNSADSSTGNLGFRCAADW